MASNYFRGDAVPKAQSQTYTFGGTWVVGETVTVTINGKTHVYTLVTGDTVIAVLIASLVSSFNALNTTYYPEFYGEISTSLSGTTKWMFTSRLAGRPFTIALSTDSSLGTIGSVTVVQASKGPAHWDDATNWSAGTIPAATEDVYIENTSQDILYGLDQSALSALNSLNIARTYTGRIGLPDISETGNYREYRQKALLFKATTCNIGYGDYGSGSSRIRWDGSSTTTTLNVKYTGQPETPNNPALLFTGSGSNILNIDRGSVGVACFPGETATLVTVRIGYKDNPSSDASLFIGAGVTMSGCTITQSGGVLTTNSALSAITVLDGTFTSMAGTCGTLTIEKGQVYYQSTGTITTLLVGSDGDIDFSRDLRARAITNTVNLYERAGFFDPNGTISGTPAFTAIHCDFSQLKRFNIGVNKTLTRS